MLAINHALAGSIIAVTIPAPLVPFAAFASHFLLDMMPHADGAEPPLPRALKIQIIIDLSLLPFAYFFALWLFPEQWHIITIGVFFSVLPDTFWAFWRRGGPQWFQTFLDWAHAIQWGERPYGWKLDVIYALLMGITLFLLSR